MESENKKFVLECKKCGNRISSFKEWFECSQRCNKCESEHADVIYLDNYANLKSLFSKNKEIKHKSMWHYFDYLPLLDEKNIVSSGEGMRELTRLEFLEKIAELKGVKCKVYGHRHDNNPSTGTFKDLAGSVVSSVLKEQGVQNYIVSSTGNIGVAYSRYLANAKINNYTFIPKDSSILQFAEISCFGQKVFRVDGDYARAKALAKEVSEKKDVMLCQGTFDPMRIEAKKTIVYDWALQMEEFPTVYIQALSGGTGPLGVDKGLKELRQAGVIEQMPRYILVQSDKCAPMAHGWKSAKENNFPEGWLTDYPILEDPKTEIMTLATGNPTAYPQIAAMVKESDGEIVDFPEDSTKDIAKLLAYECAIRVGPAAAIGLGGFISALRDGAIRDGDVVAIALGEGVRRAPYFLEKLAYTMTDVGVVEDCELLTRDYYKEDLWNRVLAIIGLKL